MMQIVSLIIYSLMLMGSMFTAYLYYASVDGELRKIMIKKYLSLSLFISCLLVASLGNTTLEWLSLPAIPYLYFKVLLIIHFIKKP